MNFLIPHAFSPKYPDPDCPPHFYARGANPQWRYFNIWAKYTNRVCHLLSGGTHIAPLAVVYHAEAEWAGECQPFEKVVKILALNQIDCDIIPIDTFTNPEEMSYKTGEICIHKETFKAVIVPYSEAVPEEFAEVLLELVSHEVEDIYFFTNESKYTSIDTIVRFRTSYSPVAYDAMEDKIYEVDYTIKNDCVSVGVNLKPYESTFIIFSQQQTRYKSDKRVKKPGERELTDIFNIEGEWQVSIADAEEYPDFKPEPGVGCLGNISAPDMLPGFSGTIRYETIFDFDGDINNAFLDMGEVYEIAEVKLNNRDIGVRICPPYLFDIQRCLIKSRNVLQIDVTNTLAKKLGNNDFDRSMPQEPSGLRGPVRIFSLL